MNDPQVVRVDYVNGHGVLSSLLALYRAAPGQELRDSGGERPRAQASAELLQERDSAAAIAEER